METSDKVIKLAYIEVDCSSLDALIICDCDRTIELREGKNKYTCECGKEIDITLILKQPIEKEGD